MVKKNNQEDQFPFSLNISRTDAEQKIRIQIEKGYKIRNLNINTKKELNVAENEQNKWSKYNEELLARIFDNQTVVKEYKNSVYFPGLSIFGEEAFAYKIDNFRKDTDEKINYLDALIERLELIPEVVKNISPTTLKITKSKTRDIFIVHGWDEAAKESVSRFIEKIDLNPIILHEKPNAGRTIIEKFEDYSNVGFAIVLLTPDDIGSSKDELDKAKPRARQNVIFELGYFIGKLGRGNVCALYKEGVEIPSDYHGVLYLAMDTNNGWQLSLAREIKQAGIEIDLNKVI